MMFLVWQVVIALVVVLLVKAGTGIQRRFARRRDSRAETRSAVYDILAEHADPIMRRHAATLLRSPDIPFLETWVMEHLHSEGDLRVRLALAETILTRTKGRFADELQRILRVDELTSELEGERVQIRALQRAAGSRARR